MKINKGEMISDIILIDGYSLLLRYNRIRRRINSKLEEQVSDGIYAQVGIDECDRLVVTFYADDAKTGDAILIKDDLDAQDNKAKFIESINNMYNKLILKKMKKNKKVVAPTATQVECNSCAQNVAKIMNLCKSENAEILQMVGVDISKVCCKLTNGLVDSVLVEEDGYMFYSNHGVQMAFDPTGRSEDEIVSVIATFINAMAELNEALKPADETSEVAMPHNDEPAKEQPVKATKKQSAKSKKVIPEQNCKLTPGQKTEYNKLISEAFETIDIDSNIEKRAFTQQVRGKMLHCAHGVGLKFKKGTSIEALVRLMTPDNVERVKTLYDVYEQQIPAWFVRLSDKGATMKRKMTA